MSNMDSRRHARCIEAWSEQMANDQVASSAESSASSQRGGGRRHTWRMGNRLGDGPPADTPEALAVRARLKEAADVFRRLPNGERRYLSDMRAKWPAVVRDTMEAYGWDAPAARRPPSPAIPRSH